MGSAGSARSHQTILKLQSIVTWARTRVFEKSEAGDEFSKESSSLSLFKLVITESAVIVNTDRALPKEALSVLVGYSVSSARAKVPTSLPLPAE